MKHASSLQLLIELKRLDHEAMSSIHNIGKPNLIPKRQPTTEGFTWVFPLPSNNSTRPSEERFLPSNFSFKKLNIPKWLGVLFFCLHYQTIQYDLTSSPDSAKSSNLSPVMGENAIGYIWGCIAQWLFRRLQIIDCRLRASSGYKMILGLFLTQMPFGDRHARLQSDPCWCESLPQCPSPCKWMEDIKIISCGNGSTVTVS